MSGQNAGTGCAGCLMLLLVLWLASAGFGGATGLLIAGVGIVGLILVAALAPPIRCEICQNQLKRMSFTWTIDGKSRRVCSHCNTRLEREQSRQAMKRLRGK